LATFVQQALRYGQEARRSLERVLPDAVQIADDEHVDGAVLAAAILPELRERLSGSGTACGPVLMKTAPLARWLLQHAAEEGRRFAAWRLGARLAARVPGLWRVTEFRNGLARSLPGMLTLTEMLKSRRA